MKQRTEREVEYVSMAELVKSFEQTYGMTSDEFYKRYESGEIGDSGAEEDSDYMVWAAYLEWVVEEQNKAG